VSSAYRDERQAALEQLDALRRENDDLRHENEWLRSFVEPPELAQRQPLAHYRGAALAATLLVGGMTGASFIVRTCPPREPAPDISTAAMFDETSAAHFTEAPPPAWNVPIEVVPPPAQVPTELTLTPVAAPLAGGSNDLRDALVLHTQRCLGATPGRVDVFVAVDGHARVLSTNVRPYAERPRRRVRRCVARVFRDVVLPYDVVSDASRAHAVQTTGGRELHLFIGRTE
jgi:hypothetical protein